jgi:hypothetical protein
MSLLERFLGPEQAEVVIGTYLYPYHYFGMVDLADLSSATAVVATIPVASEEIMITCNGGLFARPPEQLKHFSPHDVLAKLRFEQVLCNAFNQILCELALHGLVSEPASPVHLSVGKFIEGHALIISGKGGRELYTERTMAPGLQLITGRPPIEHMVPRTAILDKAAALRSTSKLSDISETLPTLVAGAYSLLSRSLLSEALIDSWIVVEQLIDWLWTNYLKSLMNKKRKERLADSKTYTAAVRTEVLGSIGTLPLPLCEEIHQARKHRNELAHRARIDVAMATETAAAMQRVIEFVCDTRVEPPLVSQGVNW